MSLDGCKGDIGTNVATGLLDLPATISYIEISVLAIAKVKSRTNWRGSTSYSNWVVYNPMVEQLI